MLSTIYFWKGKRVHIYEGDNHGESIRNTEFIDCYAIDSNEIENMRYGKYLKTGWKHIPLEEFPKEFRTHLFLLGIT